MGHRVTLEARARGAIIRPLGDTVVLMPPLSIQPAELRRLVEITAAAIAAAAGAARPRARPPERGGRRQRGQRGAAARPGARGASAAAAPIALEARAGLGDLDEAHGHGVQAPAAAPLRPCRPAARTRRRRGMTARAPRRATGSP